MTPDDWQKRQRNRVKILAVVQSRLNSSRLPGKALVDLAGKPLTQHVIDRVSAIKGIAGVILAIPASDARAFQDVIDGPVLHCDPTLAEHDVLGRFASVAQVHLADAYVRITGDCPLLAPDVAGHVIDQFISERADFASNDTLISGYPDGVDVEIFTRALLERAHREATDPADREHVTRWMKTAQGVRTTLRRSLRDYAAFKWSVDTKHDLDTVRAILAQPPKDFTFAETIKAAEKAARKIA